MTPLHVLPLSPRSGPDHRIGASRCPCDPLAAEVIGEGPSGPVVWIHRPMYELAESRQQSERQGDPATGSASAPHPGRSRLVAEGAGGGIGMRSRHGPFDSLRHAGNSSTFLVTRPVLCPLEDQS